MIDMNTGVKMNATAVAGLRCAIFICLVYFSVVVTWKTILLLVILAGTLFLFKADSNGQPTSQMSSSIRTRNNLACKDLQPIKDTIYKLMSFDAENSPTLESFDLVKEFSDCILAKSAKLWGSPLWDSKLLLVTWESTDYVPRVQCFYRTIPTLIEFTMLCEQLKLDGFLYVLPSVPFGTNVKAFSKTVYTVLSALSEFDPAGVHSLSKSYVGLRGWTFQFNGCHLFVTTFASFYPTNSSRFTFRAEDCYILLQPYSSFGRHCVGAETTQTNWENPTSIRDKIRVAFREKGRRYRVSGGVVPNNRGGAGQTSLGDPSEGGDGGCPVSEAGVRYPTAHDIVKPIQGELNGAVVEWWKAGRWSREETY